MIPMLRDRQAHHLLGAPAVVDVGRVDEVHPCVSRLAP